MILCFIKSYRVSQNSKCVLVLLKLDLIHSHLIYTQLFRSRAIKSVRSA